MSRLNVILALVLVVCALAVIQAQHRARTYFVELERLKKICRGSIPITCRARAMRWPTAT